ncbi:MAG TPA: type IX secretion system membrane protein PorP/SprF [Salinivirgaceae bacterium]|nr:type IX secretion system membrane protein PorP/SprF [Salinivirgaceae bacterium]
MKRTAIILIGILFLGIRNSEGQQMYQLSQYMFNDYVFNPAIGGIYDYYQVRTNYRYQWAGIKDAPRTYMLSAYGPHKSMPMGYGGFIFSDVTGPTTQLGIYGSYAYNILVYQDIRVSAGTFIGLKQFKIDMTALRFADPEPATDIHGDNYVKYLPDASIGVYTYNSQFYFGLSMNQLFGNKIEIINEYQTKVMAKLNNHIFIMGGYRYNINRDLDVEGASMFKIVRGSPLQMDLNVKGIWRKMAWGGISWRTGDAIALMGGYNYQDMLYVGYSYDIMISQLRKFGSGSHEVMVGVKFNRIKDNNRSGVRRKIR